MVKPMCEAGVIQPKGSDARGLRCGRHPPQAVDDFHRHQPGQVRWMIVDDAFNSGKLIEFLAALVKDADKKIFLMLDNLRVHHSKPVKAWLAEHKDQIEVFYLPSYSPDLNPDERLNADLKCALGSRVQTRTKDKLTQAAKAHMSLLEQQPERVRSYFNDPKIRYAA